MEDVLIGELRAKAADRPNVAQGGHHIAGRVAEQPHQIEYVRAKAAALREQVDDPEFSCDPRIEQPKVRVVVDHPVHPAEFSRVHQDRLGGGGEGFCRGADLEHRVGVDRLRAADFSRAEPSGEHDLLPHDDAEGHAGDMPRGHAVPQHGGQVRQDRLGAAPDVIGASGRGRADDRGGRRRGRQCGPREHAAA